MSDDALSAFERAQARAQDPRYYRQRPHALAPEVEFEAKDDRLAWEDSKNARGELAYADIARMRLTYDPARIRQTRHVLDIEARTGARVRITSTTFAGMGLYKPRNRAFVAFLTDLHRRIAASGARPACEIGRGWAPYLAYLAVWITCLAAFVWGAWQFWLANQTALGLALLLMTAYFGWMAATYARNNRPGSYDPADPPLSVLPKPTEGEV
jgi:hypothetical protein